MALTLPYVTNKTIPKPVDLTFNGDKKVIGSASVADGFEFTAELKNYSKKIDGKEAGYVSDKLDKSKYLQQEPTKAPRLRLVLFLLTMKELIHSRLLKQILKEPMFMTILLIK